MIIQLQNDSACHEASTQVIHKINDTSETSRVWFTPDQLYSSKLEPTLVYIGFGLVWVAATILLREWNIPFNFLSLGPTGHFYIVAWLQFLFLSQRWPGSMLELWCGCNNSLHQWFQNCGSRKPMKKSALKLKEFFKNHFFLDSGDPQDYGKLQFSTSNFRLKTIRLEKKFQLSMAGSITTMFGTRCPTCVNDHAWTASITTNHSLIITITKTNKFECSPYTQRHIEGPDLGAFDSSSACLRNVMYSDVPDDCRSSANGTTSRPVSPINSFCTSNKLPSLSATISNLDNLFSIPTFPTRLYILQVWRSNST